MGTAFNKSFGTGTTNIAEIGATLVASRIVETDANAKIISVAKNTGYNLATGTTSGTVATGDHTHTGVYEPVISSKKTAFNVDFGTTHTTAAYGDHTHSGVYTSVITSNTTLYVGTGQTYTTLQAALDYLADKMIAPNALVTISIVAGIYTNSAVTVSHANGDRIQIIGGNYTTYDVTSAGYPFTGSSGNYTVVLYTSSAPSVSVGQCVLIETSSIGWYSGCHRITSYGANYITVNIRNTSTGLPTNGIVTMTGLRVLPTVIAPNSGSYGLILDSTNLYNISNIAITGVNTSNIIALYLRNSQVNTIDGCGFNQGAYGIYLLNNSSCTLSGTNCIQDFIYGINITNSSQMQMASGARTRIVKTTTGIRGYNDSFLTTNSTYINIYNAVVTTTPAFGTTAGNNNTVFLNT
jgi:parallel beta-helix repeat protein